MNDQKLHWEWELSSKSAWSKNMITEILAYRELIFRLVRRETLIQYQQTLLGPVWILIQPIITVLTFVLVFYKIVGLSTYGIPPVLFYLSGITLWNLFADVFSGVTATFSRNAHVFSKVYFPRIIAPLSTLLLNGFFFAINFTLLIIVLLYYAITGDVDISPAKLLYCFVAVTITAGLAFGSGLILSVFTARYRDLMGFLNLIIRMLMFVCPVFYSVENISPRLKSIVLLNPLSSQFELFRAGLFNKGEFTLAQIGYSFLIMTVVLFLGTLYFTRKGDKLIDVL